MEKLHDFILSHVKSSLDHNEAELRQQTSSSEEIPIFSAFFASPWDIELQNTRTITSLANQSRKQNDVDSFVKN